MNLKNKIVASLGLFAGAVALEKIISEDKALDSVVLPEGFTVTAHTGCEKTKDNSLDAITLGFGYGADIVEFDLFFDKNGIAVMSHDEPKGDVFTIEDAFKLIAGYNNLRINVDVKKTDDLKQVTALAEKYGLSDRMFYTGITAEFVEAVKNSTPEVEYYLNKNIEKSRKEDEAYINELISEVKSLGACGLNIHHSGCSKKMVDAFRREGLKVSVWTVNKRSDMIKMLVMGCDNITTRKPQLLKEIIEKIK